MKLVKLDTEQIDRMLKTLERLKTFAEKLEEYIKFLEENQELINEAKRLKLLTEEEDEEEEVEDETEVSAEEIEIGEVEEGFIKKIVPVTSPAAEIHVYRHDDCLVLEWWKSGRKTDSVKILDELMFYRKMRALAKDGILKYTDFWRAIRHINGMNTNKATMIFNYYGLDPAFNTRIERIQDKMAFLEFHEWCIVFEDEGEPEEYIPPDPETMRRYWMDLLG